MRDNSVDDLQGMLDGVGTIPVFGEVADGANGFISLARGNKAQAALSFGAMIPIVGWGATAMKLSKVEVKATYSVYQGLEGDVVKYVGITKRAPAIRWAEHAASDGPKSSLFYRTVEGGVGLTRTQARVMEQTLINQHGLDNLYNQINSIAPKNWWQYGITP
jgi:hypothetical protein